MISLNDFSAEWAEIRADALAAVDRVGQSGRYILGEEVARFEAELAEEWGGLHVVGCGNGQDAIELALTALGLERGDKVLTTPLSSFATTLAVVRAGGVPVFVDVDEDGLLDLELSERALSADRAIRFVLPVHLYGFPLDAHALQAIAERHGVTVVEDCAQAAIATSQGRVVGSIGRAACTSFYPTKNLGCLGDGGALLSRDAGVAARARSLRDYGRVDRHTHAELGMNSRLDEMQAAILRTGMLPRLRERNRRRAAVAREYLSRISNPALKLPRRAPSTEPAWHLFPVLVSGDRDGFREHMTRAGVDTGLHFPLLIPDQPALARSAFEVRGVLERARGFASHEVSLPAHPRLSESQVASVIDACNEWRP